MDKGNSSSSSAIATRLRSNNSINRKRKKTKQPAADADVVSDDLRSLHWKKRYYNPKISARKLFEELSGLVSKDDSVLTTPDPEEFAFKLYLYGMILERLVLTTDGDDPSRGKIRHKIFDQYVDFMDKEDWVSKPEQVLYTLRAYPIFIEWLNEIEPLTDCRGKAIEQMLELLVSSISGSKDVEERFVIGKKRPEPVYKLPEQLVYKLRPYARFLEWLEEETNRPDDKGRGNIIATMLRFLSEDKDGSCTAQRVLHIVHINVGLLKSCDEKNEGTTKNQEPAEKNQTSTSNPIMDGLSEDDRKSLKRFLRKDQGIALQVFGEFREYQKQVMESEGFDFDTYPGSFDHMTPIHPVGLFSSDLINIDCKKLAELAIDKRKIKFKEAVRVNVRRHWRTRYYYLTFLGHYEESLHCFKTLVYATLNNVTNKEDYEVLSFGPELTELGPSGSALDNDVTKKLRQTSLDPEDTNLHKIPDARVEKLVKDKGDNHKAKRVTRASAKSIEPILESELKVDKPKAGRVTRRPSKSIAQVLESEGTKENVSYDPEGEYSNHKTCEKHREELSRYKSFIDMPDGELLQKIREAYRSTAEPLIKELRQYFEQVSKSEGFNIGQYPGFFSGVTSIIKPFKWSLWCQGHIPLEKLAELAIQSYNDENGSQFEFESLTEVNVSEAMHYHYYITFLAHTGNDVAETFQALVLVNMALLGNYKVHFCRLAHKLN